jgi:hypothetical protein
VDPGSPQAVFERMLLQAPPAWTAADLDQRRPRERPRSCFAAAAGCLKGTGPPPPPLPGPYRCADRDSPTDVAEGLNDLVALDATALWDARLRRYRGCPSHRGGPRSRQLRRTVRCRGCLGSALDWHPGSAEPPCTTPRRSSPRSRDCWPEATLGGSPTGSAMRNSTR